MNRNNLFAKLVDRDWGNFPGRIREIISGFEVFLGSGWGKGISGRHLKKIIDRDESTFTTTWAELRRDYFRELIPKMSRELANVKVPLPCHPDGRVLTDREIRVKVKDGSRLMFCPILKSKQLKDSFLFPLQDYQFLQGWSDLHLEIDSSSRQIDNPYWFWIDCKEGGTTIYSEALSHLFPTLVEYLIADFVFKEELARPLDKDIFIWLRHFCEDKRYTMLGGELLQRVRNEKIIDFGRMFEGTTSQSSSVRRAIKVRFTKVL